MRYTSNMYLLFDIGGTHTRLAVADEQGSPTDLRTFNTALTFEQGLKDFSSRAAELARGQRFQAAAGGFPGPFGRLKKDPLAAYNLPGWLNKPLKQTLQRELGCDIYLENDAALSALGEANFGAGRGYEIIAYLTVGTGVGGARIVDGQIDKCAIGFEPGHQLIDIHGNLELEQLIGGRQLAAKYGKPLEQISDPEIWDQLAKNLAVGIHNLVVSWSPDVVILGGGIVRNNALSLNAVERHLRTTLKIFPDCPPVKRAELEPHSVLWGALTHLREALG